MIRVDTGCCETIRDGMRCEMMRDDARLYEVICDIQILRFGACPFSARPDPQFPLERAFSIDLCCTNAGGAGEYMVDKRYSQKLRWYSCGGGG